MSPAAKLRALVVDDSAYNRQTITAMLESLPDVEVVGRAMNGKEALKMAFDLEPDVITLDLEMPEMDGFAFLRFLMSKRPTPVLVVSGYAQRENVFRALELGALDFLAKPTRDVSPDLKNIRLDLQRKVEVVRKLQVVRLRDRARARSSSDPVPTIIDRDVTRLLVDEPPSGPPPTHVIGVVASTGGPPAVQQLVCALPRDLPAAIVIAQHMPARFTKAFAERLNRLAALRVVEAQDGHRLCAGVVYIAPGSGNVEVELPLHPTPGQEAVGVVRVVGPGRQPTPVITPSGDHLFKSLARAYGPNLCGVVLTGMGSDGTQGAIAAKARGATILVEDPDAAVMPGMPYSVVEAKVADAVLPMDKLPVALLAFCGWSGASP